MGAIFEFYVEDDTILMGRLLGRRMHSETGAIHHVTGLAAGGADPLRSHDHDHDHEQRSSSYVRREDDQDEAEIEKRMRSFKRFMPQIRQTLRQFSKGTCDSWRHCYLGWVVLTFDGLRSSRQLHR